ncbi:MAG TPA: hypothetical protein VJT84_06375 [Gaiellaceae bacterium]|nr:hypothetical protein [Gaiellaceae bacterium]
MTIALGSAGVLAGAASPHQTRCVVQLRVNVFGTTSPQSNWALQGGLNAGKQATLRATARGCASLHHISGRWVAGGSGTIPRTACSGTTCFLRVRSQNQSAADFQAYASPLSGGALVRSNIVRVAWAGSGLEGSYTTYFRGTVTRAGARISLSGNSVTIRNQHGQTATGTWDAAAKALVVTKGWPDSPITGTVSVVGGKIRIDWPVLKDGGPGGYWLHD